MDSVSGALLDVARLVQEPLGHLVLQAGEDAQIVSLTYVVPEVGIGPVDGLAEPGIGDGVGAKALHDAGQAGAVILGVAVAVADPALDLV